ncbi:MAG: MotA/TolQ/ExbB proton channel family protein [Puniceicoccales bacterium]|jgi:biopolymer transport protein ExbB|nr:MotA/TolQ/ExbB proton channel family protein [Puniceicoccales bacterium]
MNDTQEFSLVASAGPLVWPLLVLGALAVVFFIERLHYLHRGQIRAAEFLEGIKNSLRQSRLVEALTVCEEAPGPVPRVVKAILLRATGSEERMRSAAAEAALLEVPALERRVGALAAIAKLAPLLGLAGTVFALLRAFLAMRAHGHYATADAFAGDVAAALAVTAMGLVLAALAHLAHHFLCDRVRSLLHDIEWSAQHLIQFVLHELPAGDTAAAPATAAATRTPDTGHQTPPKPTAASSASTASTPSTDAAATPSAPTR